MQRQHRLPVFDAARCWHDPDPRHPGRWQFAIPCVNVQTDLIALHWVERLVQHMLRDAPSPAADGDALTMALAPYQVRGYNSIRFLEAAHRCCSRIAQFWLDGGAVICDVNGQPQIGDSTTPGIYRQVLRSLLPAAYRIPVVLVVDPDAALACRLQAAVAHCVRPWGLAFLDGVWEGHEPIAPVQPSAFQERHVLAVSRTIAGAIVVMTPARIMLGGLPFDRIALLLVAGCGAAEHWSSVARDAMWRMVLPHVATAVICSRGQAVDATPAGSRQAPEPAWHIVDGGADALAQAAMPYLRAILAGQRAPTQGAGT